MTLTAWLGPLGLVAVTTLFGACAAQHYCETDVQCREDELVRCSADGHVVTQEICAHGCNTDRSACNVCEPDSLFCDSDGTTLIQCDTDGLPAQFQGQPLATDCDYGCNAQRAQCNNCSPLGQPSCDAPMRELTRHYGL